MSILLIPNEIILDISKLLRRGQIWNLYAMCKSFSWLAELEYLCIESGKFNICVEIISRTITGKFQGMSFQYVSVRGIRSLVGYYGSDKPKEGYNYSKWSISNPICCTTNNCKSCSQLYVIQQKLLEKDHTIADIFEHYGSAYFDGTIIIRNRKPLLYFKFNYFI